jgi:hypothetical protein
MTQISTTPSYPNARRRSQRVLMQVGVKLNGKDAEGKEFEENTETLAINAHGALVLLAARVITGSKVHVKHNKTEEDQECRVVFLGAVHSGKREVGLEFSTPRPTFWRVAFPPEDWTPRSPEARKASSTPQTK